MTTEAASGPGTETRPEFVSAESWFGFTRPPFHVTPDSRMVFGHRRYEEALSALHYGVSEGKGFVVVTGEVGSGKTTLMRHFCTLLGDTVRFAVVFNTGLGARDLLEAVAEDLGIARERIAGAGVKGLVDALNEFLLAEFEAGRTVVVFIDEAQNLSIEALETLRMLSNLETETEKLVQIVLMGQPELQRLLARNELKQLRSRVAVTYHLMPMEEDETAAYIAHRIQLASPARPVSFTPRAIAVLHDYARGVPRVINILCDQALLAAASEKVDAVDERIVESVIAGFEHLDAAAPRRAFPWLALTVVAAAAALLTYAGIAMRGANPSPAAVPHAVPPASPAPAAAARAAESPLRHLVSSWGLSAPDGLDAMRVEAVARATGLRLVRVRITSASAQALRLPALLLPGNPLLNSAEPALVTGIENGAWTIETAERGLVRLSLPEDAYPLAYLVPARPWMERTLARGMRGDDLLAAQRILAGAGLLRNPPNGYFGEGTTEAVEKLQAAYGIREDRAIGPGTMLALLALERNTPATP